MELALQLIGSAHDAEQVHQSVALGSHLVGGSGSVFAQLVDSVDFKLANLLLVEQQLIADVRHWSC